MSYTKQTWETKDFVTADKMNHIENGIAGLETSMPSGAYSDLTGRPVYSDITVAETVLPLTTITCENGEYYIDNALTTSPLTVGSKYRVTYDGNEYILVAYSTNSSSIAVGNVIPYYVIDNVQTQILYSMDYVNTFGISVGGDSSNGYYITIHNADDNAHTYKIEAITESLKTIDERLLSESGLTLSYGDIITSETMNYVTYDVYNSIHTVTLSDFLNAYYSYKDIRILKHDSNGEFCYHIDGFQNNNEDVNLFLIYISTAKRDANGDPQLDGAVLIACEEDNPQYLKFCRTSAV